MAMHDAQGNFIMPAAFGAMDVGLIFDGTAGQVANDCRVIDLAQRYDFPMSTMDSEAVVAYRNGPGHHNHTIDFDHAADIVTQQGGIVDDAVEWLNDHAAPDNHRFAWVEGDFMLIEEPDYQHDHDAPIRPCEVDDCHADATMCPCGAAHCPAHPHDMEQAYADAAEYIATVGETFTLKIDTANNAFADGNLSGELARLLRIVADRLETYGETAGRVKDTNGNTVGDYSLTGAAGA